MQELTAEDFAGKEGQTFRVSCDGQELDLILTQVRVRKESVSAGGRAAFSLFFSGVQPVLCEQGTHTFRHPAMEAMDIFIVPIGRNKDGLFEYQAAFS